MPKIVQGKNLYVCRFCNRPYDLLSDARDCESSHDIVYVPIERQDLKRLLMFLQIGDPSILSPNLLKTLYKYNGIKSE